MIKSIFKEKVKIIYIFIITVILLILLIGKSFAQETTYTRKQMQEMLVSTALSLYYNNYFSDYGQKAMDNLGEEYKGNYFRYGNFLWRDLNISPEEVGYSKYYHIDCSGYNFLIYKNTLGYDMSEYYKVNNYLLFYQNANPPLSRVGEKLSDGCNPGTSCERLKYYREAYTRFGYGWNSGFLGNVGRSAANNCGNTNCTKLKTDTSTAPFIYNNISGKDKNELVYYFESTSFVDLDTVKKYYAIAEDALEPGDIITYTQYNAEDKDTSGHVMFYAGNDEMTSSTGENGFTDLLLHSTGNGGGDYTAEADNKNNKLRKETSIIASSAENYIDGSNGRFETVYKTEGNYITRFAIYRPLNTMCDNNECKMSNNAYNLPLTETQLKNNLARVEFKKTQVQQYMILEKEYNTSLVTPNATKDGYTRNIISEYNSVNVGDEITYKLRLRNKLSQEEIEGISIVAEIPAGTVYVENSCTDNCKPDGNKLNWSGISISGQNEKNDITFKVKVTNEVLQKDEKTVKFKGYKVTKNNKELQLSDLNLRVEPTQNGINKDILRSNVEKFKTLVENGQISYVNSGAHTETIKSLDELLNDPTKTATLSTFGYIKLMYYNAFGLDLDALEGSVDTIGSSKIKNALFTYVAYPKGEEPNTANNELTVDVFGRKLASDTAKLTGVEALIAKMVVPGLYGGRHLKGNDLGDRTKFLRSFYNNSAYQSDLEVGDIIVRFTVGDDTTSMQTFLYLGDDEYGPILTRFTALTSGEPTLLYHTDQYLNEYYQNEELRKKTINKPSNQILNELFNKDLFAVLRPSRLGTTVDYEYNGGTEGTKNYVAYNKYKNLVTPKKNNYQLYLDPKNEKTNILIQTNTGENKFVCWTTDSTLNNCINNDSNLTKTDYQKIYAKWEPTTVTLPELTLEHYKHIGWYSDEALTKKVANVNTQYKIEKTETLYAKWEPVEYTITYNLAGGTVSGNKTTYNIETDSFTVTNPTKKGYRFTGWSGTGITGTTTTLTIEKGSTGNKEFTATWQQEQSDFQITVKDYTYDEEKEIINDISIGTTKEQLLSKITTSDGYTVATNVTNKVFTGSKIQIYHNDTLYKEITNIVLGDVNGDGELSVFDIVKINNHIIDESKQLSNIYSKAADYNKDGTLSVFDIVKMNNKIISDN